MGYLPKEKLKSSPSLGLKSKQWLGSLWEWGQPADVARRSWCFSFISSNRPAKVDKGCGRLMCCSNLKKNNNYQEDGEILWSSFASCSQISRLWCGVVLIWLISPYWCTYGSFVISATEAKVVLRVKGTYCEFLSRVRFVSKGDLGDYFTGSWHTKALRCHND